MSDFRKKVALFPVLSNLILSFFLFVLGIKGLNALEGIRTGRSVFVIQLVFSFVIFIISILAALTIRKQEENTKITNRLVNVVLAFLTLMELIQVFVLIGELKKEYHYDYYYDYDDYYYDPIKVPTKTIVSIVFYIFAVLIFIIGCFTDVTASQVACGLGCFLSLIALAINIDITNMSFRIQDFFYLLSFSTGIFYAFSTND